VRDSVSDTVKLNHQGGPRHGPMGGGGGSKRGR